MRSVGACEPLKIVEIFIRPMTTSSPHRQRLGTLTEAAIIFWITGLSTLIWSSIQKIENRFKSGVQQQDTAPISIHAKHDIQGSSEFHPNKRHRIDRIQPQDLPENSHSPSLIRNLKCKHQTTAS